MHEMLYYNRLNKNKTIKQSRLQALVVDPIKNPGNIYSSGAG